MTRLAPAREAELLAQLSALLPPSGSIDVLAGPRLAGRRAALLTTILGRRSTQREAGFNALREALRVGLGIPLGCLADVDHQIAVAVAEYRLDRLRSDAQQAAAMLRIWGGR